MVGQPQVLTLVSTSHSAPLIKVSLRPTPGSGTFELAPALGESKTPTNGSRTSGAITLRRRNVTDRSLRHVTGFRRPYTLRDQVTKRVTTTVASGERQETSGDSTSQVGHSAVLAVLAASWLRDGEVRVLVAWD